MGQKFVAHQLVAHGANLNVRVDEGKFSDDHDSISCEYEGFTLAHLCALNNDIDTAKILLKAGCNFEDKDCENECTPLHTAIMWSPKPSLEFVKFLVEEVQVDIGIIHGEDEYVTAAELAFAEAFDDEDTGTNEEAFECKRIFYYLKSRSEAISTWNFLCDWMKLEKCCTLL